MSDAYPFGEDQWPDLLEAYYGVKLNDKQATVWMQEVFKRFNGEVLNADICAAIRRASDEGVQVEKYKATVRDLQRWLGMYWAARSAKAGKAQSGRDVPGYAISFVGKWITEFKADPENMHLDDDLGIAASALITQHNDGQRAYLAIIAEIYAGFLEPLEPIGVKDFEFKMEDDGRGKDWL